MKLTENKRILLNVCATYARSLLNLACGLFTVRWLVKALGLTDFGLYGLIGGLIVFMDFINGLFSGAISRFYAYAIGQANVAECREDALYECRDWFSAAVAIYTFLPLVLVVVGWPIGDYAISHAWLNIPLNRVGACRLVWGATCLNGFTAMLATPVWAMYTAKQNIAEMTVFHIGLTLARFCFIYIMTLYSRDWLAMYALGLCVLGITMRLGYTIQAFRLFPECRLRKQGFLSFSRYKRLMAFAGWQGISNLGQVIRGQAIAILVNKMFGAQVNAAMAIGNQVAGASATLSGALQGAFAPAVTTASGAGDVEKMRTLAYRTCKYSMLLMLPFAIPVTMELPEVLILWLVTPPRYAGGLCLCMMVAMVMQKSSLGHGIAVSANGVIAKFSIAHGLCVGSALLFAVMFAALGYGVYSVGVAFIISTFLSVIGDVWIARSQVGLSIKRWVTHVIVPVAMVAVAVIIAGSIPIVFVQRSVWRILATIAFCWLAFFTVAYMVLEQTERVRINNVAQKVKESFRRAYYLTILKRR